MSVIKQNRIVQDLGVLKVATKLMTAEGLTQSEIGAELGIKRNSADQYIKRMRILFGRNLVKNKNHKYILKLPNTEALKMQFLNFAEWELLDTLLAEFPDWISDQKGDFLQLREHMKSVIPKEHQVCPQSAFYRSPVGTENFKETRFFTDLEIFETLLSAIKDSKLCDLEYTIRNGETKKFILCPLLFFRKEGRLRLLTDKYSLETQMRQQKYLTLIPWHIVSVSLRDENYAPVDEGPQTLIDSAFGTWYGDSFEVKIWFSQKIVYLVREREWPIGSKIEDSEDGGVFVTMTASGRRELLEFVLGKGDNAKVIYPPEFRDEVIEAAKKLILSYSG